MLRGSVRSIILGVLMILLLLIGVFSFVDSRQKTDIAGILNEVTEVSVMEAFDYSSRADKETLFIDRDYFEERVKSHIEGYDFMKGVDLQYKFDYLTDDDNPENTHGVRVELKLGINSAADTYYATYIVDFKGKGE